MRGKIHNDLERVNDLLEINMKSYTIPSVLVSQKLVEDDHLLEVVLVSLGTAKHFIAELEVVLAAQLFCWTGQFIGHGIFEKRAPALLDNLAQAFLMAPYFVFLELGSLNLSLSLSLSLTGMNLPIPLDLNRLISQSQSLNLYTSPVAKTPAGLSPSIIGLPEWSMISTAVMIADLIAAESMLDELSGSEQQFH
ncbi:putative endoplasmic reticulum membrane protein C16E8.02 [Camellia lanceoleosa]|uniref:Endoplasmic reticulum membrane protein C16E8.02 n=1 Tax=Camellia lanceoleosa TaxID=1840588 RepID=A0ACC0ICW4_9ERIC|nr:putative endoplasmic reticulum membrane protein C16E8.02 [Camellia lanceoleosa]